MSRAVFGESPLPRPAGATRTARKSSSVPIVTSAKHRARKTGRMWLHRCLRYVSASDVRTSGGTFRGSQSVSAHSPISRGARTAGGRCGAEEVRLVSVLEPLEVVEGAGLDLLGNHLGAALEALPGSSGCPGVRCPRAIRGRSSRGGRPRTRADCDVSCSSSRNLPFTGQGEGGAGGAWRRRLPRSRLARTPRPKPRRWRPAGATPRVRGARAAP